MSVNVRIPTPLRQFAGGQDVVTVPGETVGDVLNELVERYPSLRRHLYADDGRLRNFVNAYLNEDDIRHLQGPGTPVSEGDALTLVPSIAGGSASAVIHPDAVLGEVELSREEIQRYSRHLIMPEVGMDGQRKLKAARVLLVGAGGLGSPLGLYLAAAGVGTIGMVDHDVVDVTNLQRQLLHGTKDIGRSKLESARDRLEDVNPHVQLEPHDIRLTSDNALEVLESYDIVVDGTDNFPTRYLVNDACVLLGKPNVYGSIFRFEGQLSVFDARRGPCYRCLFREPPPPGLVPSCAEGGVLGVLPGIIGALQALETIKLVLGAGDPLIGRLVLFDALPMRWRQLQLRKDPACPVCGEHPTVTELIDYEQFCGMPADEDAAAAEREGIPQISATELKSRLDRGDDVTIIDVREPHEWDIANLEDQGARLIPLGQLAERMSELDSAREIVLHCRSGVRSAKALRQLRDAGFRKLRNLDGGILAWAETVDPSMPRY
jgi:molybdopterin/thiamine biosynthesis adenylyltransferase/rhodanese-related sulfurtransferase/molybdopterin converting factor small subunit